MRKFILLAVALTGAASAQSAQQLFGYTTPQATMLLRWTESGGQLSGAIQVVSGEASAKGADVSVFNGTVRGTRNGANYSFAIDRPVKLLGSSAMDGALKGDTLTVQVPLDSGGFGTFKLQRTSIEKFNTSVANLKTRVQQQSEALATQQQQAARLKEVTTGLGAVQRLTAALSPAASPLQRLVSAGTAQLTGLRQRNATLVQLARQKKCAEFERALDADRLARPALDDTLNSLVDQLQSAGAAANELDRALAAYATAKGAYAAAKANPALLPNDAAALSQGQSALSGANRQLTLGRDLMVTLGNDSDQLTTQNDALSCS